MGKEEDTVFANGLMALPISDFGNFMPSMVITTIIIKITYFCEGKGTLIDTDGTRYVGKWKNNKKEGFVCFSPFFWNTFCLNFYILFF